MISYVSAIANMEGGILVVGVHDKTLEIVGTDTYNYDRQKAILRLTERCTNLSSEGLDIEEYVTDDTQKVVWVIHIPKHQPKRPVYAHDKAWQRIEDSLVELTQERLNAILDEPLFTDTDWSAVIVPNATIDDLDEVAIAKAKVMFKKVHSRIPASEVNAWSVEEFLSNAGVMIDGKWGFIDKTGKEICPVIYESVAPFRHGYARVKLDGKCGLIDTTGDVVLKIKYKEIYTVEGKYVLP